MKRSWWTRWTSDAGISAVALLGSVCLAGYTQLGQLSLAEFLALRIQVVNFLVFALLVASWSVVLLALSRRIGAIPTQRSQLPSLLVSTVAGVALTAVAGRAFQMEIVSGVFLSTLLVLQLALRGLPVLGHGKHPRRIILAGINEHSLNIARGFEADAEPREVVGFVEELWTNSELLSQAGYKMVSEFKGFAEYLRGNIVDEVLICVPPDRFGPEVIELMSLCRDQGIGMLFEPAPGAPLYLQSVRGRPWVSMPPPGMRGFSGSIKRGIDVVGSAVALVALAPVLGLIALAVKLGSPGPAFFVQERVGIGKRLFPIYKFRTMVVDAEARQRELEDLNEVDGAAFKLRDDPRVTPIGRFLRATSMDELPQFYNVLRGEMSLVGPRPLPVRDYDKFSENRHRRRFSVRPGLTCLWQISGRSGLSFEDWMRLDLEYIDQWSLMLDLKILVRTVPAVIRQVGAY